MAKKTVKVLHGYRGAPSNKQYIPAGQHELDETLADYLVKNGHAVEVETPKPKRKRKKADTSDE